MDTNTSTTVVIYTDSYRIDGRIALLPGSRLTDFVRQAPKFIAVTDASVAQRDGTPLFATRFLDVGIEFIELIIPAEAIEDAS